MEPTATNPKAAQKQVAQHQHNEEEGMDPLRPTRSGGIRQGDSTRFLADYTRGRFVARNDWQGVPQVDKRLQDEAKATRLDLESCTLQDCNKTQRRYHLRFASLVPLLALSSLFMLLTKDMGDKRVKFGHDGFNARMRAMPFEITSFAENVAMSSGMRDVAGVAVNGWIESAGHRKNLLSRSSMCAIGVYQNKQGAWYLTQLFASA